MISENFHVSYNENYSDVEPRPSCHAKFGKTSWLVETFIIAVIFEITFD